MLSQVLEDDEQLQEGNGLNVGMDVHIWFGLVVQRDGVRKEGGWEQIHSTQQYATDLGLSIFFRVSLEFSLSGKVNSPNYIQLD